MLAPGTVLQARYRLEHELGRGGMGAVYRATDLRFGNTIALKQMTVEGEALQRAFEREARLLNGLRHRALPVVMDYFSEGVGLYLVMQFIPGDDLGQLLVRNGKPFSPDTVAAWADQLLGALEYLHSRAPPIVHRDIKPQNLKLTPDGEIILLDFGLAKGVSSQTQGAQSWVGFTPFYAPIEQMRGEAIDASSDIYAFSATLYHLLTGILPPSAIQRAEAIVEGRPDPLAPAHTIKADIPRALSELLTAGMAVAQHRRPSSAAIREGLRAALQATVVGVSPRAWQASGDLCDATTLPIDDPRDKTTILVPDDETTTVPNNLPHAMTNFVGRERELAEIRRRLENARLLTLTGAGGIGKTRLALQVAGGALTNFPGGVWFVDVAPVRDPDLLQGTIAGTIGVREEPGVPLAVTIARHLRARRALIVLDNCEHLIGGCASLVEGLLGSCAKLAVLATSREALGVGGELTWPLAPLSIPPEEPESATVDGLLVYEAVALFRDRAVLANPTFDVTDENATSVADICQRLDGIPLAIELAAVRVKAVPIDQIRARLGDRLSFLTRGARTASPRHQTLRAAIDWSHDLLSDEERVLFRRLAVFGSGWTLGAGKDICAGGPVGPERVAELIEQLVEKSLVMLTYCEAEQRYQMLESIHQYADEKLAESGEDDSLRRKHRDWFAAFAERAAQELSGPHLMEWVGRLDADRRNLDAALLWSRAENDKEAVFRFVKSLSYFWYLRGYWSERVWSEQLLARDDLPEEFRAEALSWLGGFAYLTGDYEKAEASERECLRLRRQIGNMRGVAGTLSRLGMIAHIQGDHESARARFAESLALSEELGNRRAVAEALTFLGGIELDEGNYERAEELFAQSNSIYNPSDGGFSVLNAIPGYLARIARARGDYARARTLVSSQLAEARARGFKHPVSSALLEMGDVARAEGKAVEAVEHYLEALAIADELGDRANTAYALSGLAGAGAWLGREREALQLAGAAAAVRVRCKAAISKSENDELEYLLTQASASLGEEETRRAFDDGAALTTAELRRIAERFTA